MIIMYGLTIKINNIWVYLKRNIQNKFQIINKIKLNLMLLRLFNN